MTPYQRAQTARRMQKYGEQSYVEGEKLLRSGELPDDLRTELRDGMAAWIRLLRTVRVHVEAGKEGER